VRVVDPAGRAPPRELLNACANNYLGLANHPRVVAAAKRALDTHGFGMASVRFIVGQTDLHVELEKRLASWLGAEDCILFPSCFDANAGAFEALLLSSNDAIISDTLNHASIIDGVRLCKARRYRFPHRDVEGLAQALEQAEQGRPDPAGAPSSTIIVTDGVFSMDGSAAPLDRIVPLIQERRRQLQKQQEQAGGAPSGVVLFVDDCHASGFLGSTGRGTAEACGLLSPASPMGGVDLLSSTLGKALGGATGGFVAGRADAVARLRQAARPYLFSNSVAPCVVAASLEVLDIVQGEEGDALRAALRRNAKLFRGEIEEAGFALAGGGGGTNSAAHSPHPIVPVMLGDAALASEFARRMLDEQGVYVVAFSYPVVPKGQARIRVQLSAAHTEDDVKRLVAAFVAVGRDMGVLKKRG
jgi:glycine C-acetyltransferase